MRGARGWCRCAVYSGIRFPQVSVSLKLIFDITSLRKTALPFDILGLYVHFARELDAGSMNAFCVQYKASMF